jgi:hypothetical protein
MSRSIFLAVIISIVILLAGPAVAGSFSFSTGAPDGRMGAGSRPASFSQIEIQSADDFISTAATVIHHATFTGLIPGSEFVSQISQVTVEIFRVFPNDSVNPPSGRVPTRVNSPGDNAFAYRDSAAHTLSFIAAVTNGNFTVANTVLNGINPKPNQTTGGEGAVSGQEVSFDVTFTSPIFLPPGHYFFIPQVHLPSGLFLWLSAPYPANPPFSPDLEGWIRNTNLSPDWLRIGTDIVGGGVNAPKFNFSFSLAGIRPGVISALELLLLQ